MDVSRAQPTLPPLGLHASLPHKTRKFPRDPLGKPIILWYNVARNRLLWLHAWFGSVPGTKRRDFAKVPKALY